MQRSTCVGFNISYKEIIMGRVYNFSAGPAVLPEEVLKEAAAEMLIKAAECPLWR